MPNGFWNATYERIEDADESARNRLMLVAYLHDLQETAPEALNELAICIKLSKDPRFTDKLSLADLTKLIPRRELCKRCDSPIDYDDESEHGWNLAAMKQGFCSALCLEYQ